MFKEFPSLDEALLMGGARLKDTGRIALLIEDDTATRVSTSARSQSSSATRDVHGARGRSLTLFFRAIFSRALYSPRVRLAFPDEWAMRDAGAGRRAPGAVSGHWMAR